MSLMYVLILAIVQGLAELLPVSSSAHVIVAAKLLHLPPISDPPMTLLLIMLHTGTMFAVIVYFWRAWKTSIFASRAVFQQQALRLALASALTAAVYLCIKKCIVSLAHLPKGEIESLFDNLGLVAGALAAAGILILIAGLAERATARERTVGIRESLWIGAVQGLCLPFRGFSRSGATISTGLLLGVLKTKAEEFSFALAVILTPAAIAQELSRFIEAQKEAGDFHVTLEPVRHEPLRYGLCLPGRFAGAEVAFTMAGERAVVSFRRVLSCSRRGSFRAPFERILKRTLLCGPTLAGRRTAHYNTGYSALHASALSSRLSHVFRSRFDRHGTSFLG